MKRNKLLFKAGFYYYNLLAFITNGNRRFVDKKLIFGALLIGLSSYYGCKTKTTDNQSNTNTNNKTENNKDTSKKEEIKGIYLNTDKDTTIKKEINGIEINYTPTCYLISKESETKQPVQVEIFKKNEEVIDDSLSFILCYSPIMPEYHGGDEKLQKFLQDNLIYPQSCKDSNIQGTVYVGFTIEEDGNISDVKILRGVNRELDAEALRVIKLLPKWIPGEQRGKPIRMQFNMPIKFTLDTIKK